MTVSDLMRTDVVTAVPDTPAKELAARMRDENVGSVVVEEGGAPVGIVTDRDLAVGPFLDGDDPAATPAEAVMTSDPATVAADTGVMELCDQMYGAGVRRMPVVDDDGSLAGIVTLDDLTVLLTTELVDLAGIIESESPPY
jgi:CBS domain-containing protein